MPDSGASQPRILVFCGAGASYSVDAERFPTTVQFFEQLPSDLVKDEVVTLIRSKCEKRFGKGPADVEKILWSLSELERFFDAIKDEASPVNWVCSGNRVQAAVGSNYGINEFVHLSNSAASHISRLKDRINAQVYSFYSSRPTEGRLRGNWLRLLKALKERGHWIDLVTTNYDLILETAVGLLNLDIGNGFSNDPVRELQLDRWQKALSKEDEFPYKDGLITKLHGSVHWEDEPERVVLGGTAYKGDHSRHALISPGFKGMPTREPFVTFHDYFERSITRSDKILFIGFAFRDDYINDLIRRNIGTRKIVCIDPGSLSGIPRAFSDNVMHIPEAFAFPAIDKFLASL